MAKINVLLTGASGGIGAAIFKKLATKGLYVLGIARRSELLEKLKQDIRDEGGKVDVFRADLSCKEERLHLEQFVRNQIGVPNVVINNAGFGWYGYHAKILNRVAEEMLAVNVQAPVHLSLMFLAEMVSRGSGHLIQMGSIAGDIPSQGIGLYAGTKSFLSAFNTGLHRELRGSGVHASIIKPGPVKTAFFDNSKALENGEPVPSERFAVLPNEVANAVYSVILHPRRVVYVPTILAAVPWVEMTFAWLMDRIGPLLLRRKRS